MAWVSILVFTVGVVLAGYCLLALSPEGQDPSRRLGAERLALLAAQIFGAVATLLILLPTRPGIDALDILLLGGPLIAAGLPRRARRRRVYLGLVAFAAVLFLVAGEFGGVWLAFYFWPGALLLTSAVLLGRRRVREGGEAGEAGRAAGRAYSFASDAALLVPLLALLLAAVTAR